MAARARALEAEITALEAEKAEREYRVHGKANQIRDLEARTSAMAAGKEYWKSLVPVVQHAATEYEFKRRQTYEMTARKAQRRVNQI